MDRRDFLRIATRGVGSLAILESVGLPTYASEKKSTAIDIGALVASIERDLKASMLSDQGWYVNGVNNDSDRALIMLPELHRERKQGLYNDVLAVLSKYFKSVGFEASEYGAADPIASIVELQRLIDGLPYSYEALVKKDKLIKQLEGMAKSGTRLFGLEERDLYLIGSRLGLIVLRLSKPIELKKITPKDVEEIGPYVAGLSKTLLLRDLPPYSDEIWRDAGKFKAYFGRVFSLFNKYAFVDRNDLWNEVIKREFDKNYYLGLRPNIVGMLSGGTHVAPLQESLTRQGISYVVVSTREINQKVERAQRIMEEWGKIK